MSELSTTILAALIGLTFVLWIGLPFAVFGVKSKMDHNTNKLLQEIRALRAAIEKLAPAQTDSE